MLDIAREDSVRAGANEWRMAPRPSRRPPRGSLVRRWLAVAALALVAFLYYQPLRSYLETRGTLERRTADVSVLEQENRALERRLADQTSTASLVREARRLAYVKPGERLFIVKGIPAWRRAAELRRTTIDGDGGP